MQVRQSLLIVLLSLTSVGHAYAQESQPAPPPEAEPLGPDPLPPAPVVQPTPPLTPPAAAPAIDTKEVKDLFEHALEALIRGKNALAAREFAEVAERSVEIERRSAAAELARQASRRASGASGSMSDDEFKDQESGRASFLTGTIVIGLNYGWMVPTALGLDDTRAFVGTYLLTAAASFAVPYLVTRDHHITRGMSTLGAAGSYFGVGHGALLYFALAGEDGADTSDRRRGLFATMLAASIAEGTAGYWWAREKHISAGHAVSMSSGALWGGGYAALANLLIFEKDMEFRPFMGSILAGSVGGVLGGHFYNEYRKPTEGDASLVSFSGILGGFAMMSPLLISETENGRVIAAGIAAGLTLGLVGGDHFVKDKDYTRGQAGVISLGSLAGGLLGAGGTFLLAPDDNTGKWIVTGSAAGAIGGLLVMLKAVEPGGDDSEASIAQLTPIVGPNGETGLGLAGAF